MRWHVILAVFAVLTLRQWWVTSQEVEVIPYSEFEQQLKDDKIAENFVHENCIEGRLKKPLTDGRQAFYTTRVDPPLSQHLSQYNVKYTAVVENTFSVTSSPG